jgi:phosphomannomutase
MQIKFGTDGWRGIIAKDFTTANVQRVAYATAVWARQQDPAASIVVGYDCRFGGSLFASAAINVFCGMGMKVYYDPSFVSTPMISLAAKKLNCELGVILTASHNPPSYNGYKLKTKAGGPLIQRYITEIENMIPAEYAAEEKSVEEWVKEGLLESVDLEQMYFEHVSESFDMNAMQEMPFVVGYDAMFGAGQSIVPRILPHAELLHCDYNPSFYGVAPEPIHKNLKELSDYIKSSKHIDFAFATDGDADRIGVYDSKGNFVDPHHVILLLIHILHKYKGMSGKVVIAFSVSNKVKKLCEAYRLPVQVTKIGFKYICEVMVNENVLLGGEESGGIAVKGHIPERDGVWNGLLLIEQFAKSGKNLQQLIDEVYAIVGRFSYNRNDLHLKEELKQQIIANCQAGKYTSFHDIPVSGLETIDGFKYYLADEETVMIRPSGTEPVLRIYAEASSPERVEEILRKVQDVLLNS